MYQSMSHLIDKIEVSTLFDNLLRDVSWSLLTAIAKLLDGAYDAISVLLGMDFFDIPAVKELTETIHPVAWVVFVVFLLAGAIFLMVSPDKLKISEFARGIVLSALLIVLVPIGMQSLEMFKEAGVEDMNTQITSDDGESSTIGRRFLSGIIVDVNKSRTQLSELSGVDPYRIDPTAVLPKSGPFTHKIIPISSAQAYTTVSSSGLSALGFTKSEIEALNLYEEYDKGGIFSNEGLIKDLIGMVAERTGNDELKNYSSTTEIISAYALETDLIINSKDVYTVDSMYVAVPLQENSFSITDMGAALPDLINGPERIYAYHFDFLNGFAILLISLIAIVFAGIKIGVILFDLVFHQIITPIVFASDLHNSGRSKKLVQSLIGHYVVFIIILLILKLYMAVTLWSAEQNHSWLVQLIIVIATAKSLIDGPDIVLRLLGVDAGVKSGYGALVGIQTAGRMASSATNIAMKPATGVASKLKGLGAVGAVGAAGVVGSASAAAGATTQATTASRAASANEQSNEVNNPLNTATNNAQTTQQSSNMKNSSMAGNQSPQPANGTAKTAAVTGSQASAANTPNATASPGKGAAPSAVTQAKTSTPPPSILTPSAAQPAPPVTQSHAKNPQQSPEGMHRQTPQHNSLVAASPSVAQPQAINLDTALPPMRTSSVQDISSTPQQATQVISPLANQNERGDES